MKIQKLKGTQDVLPQESAQRRYIEEVFHEVCRRYAYGEIRIPTFEMTQLFQRGVGDSSDVVNKEMYSFEDRGGRQLSLRPEATSGVVRAYIENGLTSTPAPQKLYYLISAFRAENVQAGRFREFNQFGVEAFASESPSIDLEVISLANTYFQNLGLKNYRIKLNSIGDPESRQAYRLALLEFFRPRLDALCPTCRERLEKNPLRLLDCKEVSCQGLIAEAPVIDDYLSEASRAHDAYLREGLEALGIAYEHDSRLVRGLDYYTKTVFEFVLDAEIGSQAATICGGGRYDGLVEQLGGAAVPGIGFSLGEERLLMALREEGLLPELNSGVDLFIAAQSDAARLPVAVLAQRLRELGLAVEIDLMDRSLKAQMKYANKSGARYALVIGDAELETESAQLRDLRSREVEDRFVEISDPAALFEILSLEIV